MTENRGDIRVITDLNKMNKYSSKRQGDNGSIFIYWTTVPEVRHVTISES